MTSLAQAALRPEERRVLDRFVERLREELGDSLLAVWLYGSRARGEWTHDESDVDLIVVLDHEPSLDEWHRLGTIMWDAAEAEGISPFTFSEHYYSREYVEGRRAIRSFFMQEVDRDKIVLYGEP